ncbi:putative bifunctional diguanylate cyclase/phosphodiesterase [Spirilliplanes yamanashiensis]|uniref:putative bifunctional diguanylate cyclase/phosphodiesterase n=1 Tax=Spirilliplanes yamanashiensis TaxID=42233 RepID=UPI001EF2EDFB|nr:bifunctional diguanylate cyclase/phosphodiesterase [Spirilliplanes yamanashiensis]MDP9817748.1 diguanylate cyclase (GGDEF)-like protein [Spirilliplanes yamanashiensis]
MRTGPSTTGRWQWRAFAAAAAAATVLYVADVSLAVSMACFAVIGAGSVAAMVAGPRMHRVRARAAWRLMTTAASLFLLGVVVRPFVSELSGWQQFIADMLVLPGYFVLLPGVVLLLRARGGLERQAVLDAFIVCIGAGLACALLLSVPAASVESRSVLASVLSGLYPFFDVALVLVFVNMAFTTTVWRPSQIFLTLGVVSLLVGDLAYGVISTRGEIYGSPLLDAPYLVTYGLLGLAALHPSVAELDRATRPPPQAWSWQRLTLLVPVTAVPFVLDLLAGGRSAADRLIIAVGGMLIALLLIARAVSAVQAEAAAQRHAEHQARHDPLTGLPNRRQMAREIGALLAAAPRDSPARVWVYALDLDGFKFVNESYGHDAGDQLVIDVGRRLTGLVPPGTPVARIGGDEFVVAEIGDAAHAARTAERILAAMAEPLAVQGTDVVVSASVGIASAAATPDADGTATAEALMRDADTALFRSKTEGPGRSTMFDTSMHEQARDRVELEGALRTALTRGELHVAYQPIVAIADGRPVGAEALVRWDHPRRGPIPPGVFIPIAEEAGLIDALGTWVRQESLRQLAQWRAEHTVSDDFWMSINVSPRQLRDGGLPAAVGAELTGLGLPAGVVTLEITESVMVDASTQTDQVLFELRALGVRLAVDDFGTGFSALGYLRRFPVTGVKIDRSFVSGLGTDHSDSEIVRAVVAMSTALGLSTVAEGVETVEQRDALASLGVPLGQGWLWGKAVTAAQFATRWGAIPGVPDAAAARRPLTAGN